MNRLSLLPLLLLALPACRDTIEDARAADDLGRDRPLPSIMRDGTPQTAAGNAPVEDVVAASFSADEAYATPGIGANKSSAAYMSLENDGSHPVVIHRVSTPIGEAALHGHRMAANGTMEMPELRELVVPPHTSLILKPGGTHVMLTGLSKALKAGDGFPITFEYNKGAVMTTQVFVLSPAEVQTLRTQGGGTRSLEHLHH